MKRKNILLVLLLYMLWMPILSYGEFRVSLEHYLLDTEPAPGCLKVGKQGNIYIADKKNYVIHMFSPEGKYLLAFGGKGQGPGFFQRWLGVYDIGVNGDICQADFFNGNRRITRFTADGQLIDSSPIKGGNNQGATDILALKNGKFIVGIIWNVVVETRGNFRLMGVAINYSIVDSKGNIEKSLFKEKVFFSFSDKSESGWPNLPYASYIISAYSPLTDTFVYQLTGSTTLKIIKLETNRTFEIANGFQCEKLQADDLKNWVEKEKETNKMFRYMKPLYNTLLKQGTQIITTKPVVQRVFFNPEGQCFIVAYKEKEKKYPVRKFSRDFKILKTLELESIPFSIGKSRLYYVDYEEEEDVNYMVIKARDIFFKREG